MVFLGILHWCNCRNKWKKKASFFLRFIKNVTLLKGFQKFIWTYLLFLMKTFNCLKQQELRRVMTSYIRYKTIAVHEVRIRVPHQCVLSNCVHPATSVTSIGLDCWLRISVALKMCFVVEKCFLTFHLVPLSCCWWCIYLHFREKQGTVSQSSAETLVNKCETFVSHVCFLTVTNKEVTFAMYGFIFHAVDCFDCLTGTLWWLVNFGEKSRWIRLQGQNM